ncbi:MAG: GNAT family N-acetyltransferase, partial [Xanthobacteraceae bacterium]
MSMDQGTALPLPPDMRHVGEGEIGACYELMRQLRPHLTSEAEFVERWRRQTADGYRILALWADRIPRALAGYRVQENMIHGRFLYLDDLVSREDERRQGNGGRLLEHLKAEARALGCAKLVLDSGLNNVLGHRFYYRHGLLATALRFNIPL